MNIIVINKRAAPPEGAHVVYVGRPTALGNPFAVGIDGTRDEVVEDYAGWLQDKLDDPDPNEQQQMFAELIIAARTHDVLALQCWCAPQACHADVLREELLSILENPNEQRQSNVHAEGTG